MRFIPAILLVFVSVSAFAADYVDPRLIQLANRKPYGETRVIVVLKNESYVPATAHQRSRIQDDHKRVFRALSSVVPLRDPTSIWAANSIIVSVRNDDLRRLSEQGQVAALYLNAIKRVTPVRDLKIVDPLKYAREQYTFGLNLIQAPRLRHEAPEYQGQGQVVGVIDTGIDGKHGQLKDKVAGWYDFVNKKTEPYDDSFHGTHVSGTIVGDGSTLDLRFGVAPQAKVVAFKVFHSNGTATDEECLTAMQFAMDPDGNPSTNDFPPIINNSWGGLPPDGTQSSGDNPYCRLVQAWLRTGIVGVFSAGNSGPKDNTVNEPASCPGALSVAAVDRNQVAADFSSRGPSIWKEGPLAKPDISAPGVRVFSAMPGNQYGMLSGTSMAAPHVSGMLAVLRQVDPSLSTVQAIKCVKHWTEDLGPYRADKTYGEGLVQLYNLIWAADRRMCQ